VIQGNTWGANADLDTNSEAIGDFSTWNSGTILGRSNSGVEMTGATRFDSVNSGTISSTDICGVAVVYADGG